MNFTVLFTLIISALCIIYVYVSIHIINKQKTKIVEIELQLKDALTECKVLTEELKNLHSSIKQKQEVTNETQQKLSAIASGSTSDSVARLQKPRKSRKPKNSDSSSGI